MSAEDEQALLNGLAAQAAEHFDHVLIMASRDTAAESSLQFAGAGNVYARQGMAREYLERQAGQAREVED